MTDTERAIKSETTAGFGEIATMGLGRFAYRGETILGVVSDDVVLPASSLGDVAPTMSELFSDWSAQWPRLRQAVESLDPARRAEIGLHRSDLDVLPPLEAPQIFQSAANYRKHIVDLMVVQRIAASPDETEDEIRRRVEEETDERVRLGEPYIFLGLQSALCGAYDEVILPRHSKQPDWELELAVVVGARARHVAPQDAYRYIAGYTIANDLTLRDLVFRPEMPAVASDWLRCKNPPTFLPVGPVIVPSQYVGDPMDVRIHLRLNGETMQDESTSDMLFDIAHLLSYASSIAELRAGDLLLTGSPAGNGAPMGRFLHAGDVMESTISGLGRQRNICIDEKE